MAQRSSLTTGKVQGFLNCSHWLKHYSFCFLPTFLSFLFGFLFCGFPSLSISRLSRAKCLLSISAAQTLQLTVATQAHLSKQFNQNNCTVIANGWGSNKCFILLTLHWGRNILSGQLGALKFYCSSPEVSKKSSPDQESWHQTSHSCEQLHSLYLLFTQSKVQFCYQWALYINQLWLFLCPVN